MRPTAPVWKTLLVYLLSGLTVFALPVRLADEAQANIFNFTLKDERELGEKFNILIKAKLPIIEDVEITEYSRGIINKLVKQVPAMPFPVNLSVVNNSSMNAFAAPAGYMFLFTGLIMNLEHEAELAGVLSHELAHVSQRHVAKGIEKGQIANIAAMMGMLAGMFLGYATKNAEAGSAVIATTSAAAATAMLKYSREDETEADVMGLNYLVGAGWTPSGLTGAFEKLSRMKVFKGLGDIPSWLSTHPNLPERLTNLDQRIKLLPANVRSRPNDDNQFLRVKMLCRARYLPMEVALNAFTNEAAKGDKLAALGKAIALGRGSDFAAAKAAFDTALAQNPSDTLWMREAGRFSLKVRDFNKAEDLLGRVYKANPGDLIAAYEYARLLSQSGRNKEAFDIMRRVYLRLPDDPEVLQAMALIEGNSGDVFSAHLHLAYAALYANDPKTYKFQFEHARSMARTEDNKREVEKLDKLFKHRMEVIKGIMRDV